MGGTRTVSISKDFSLARGEFETFDPTKCNGTLSLENHFINLFWQRFRSCLQSALRPRTDQKRRADKSLFTADVQPGRIREPRMPQRSSWQFGVQKLLDSISDRPWPPPREDQLKESVCLILYFPRLYCGQAAHWRKRCTAASISVSVGSDRRTVRFSSPSSC